MTPNASRNEWSRWIGPFEGDPPPGVPSSVTSDSRRAAPGSLFVALARSPRACSEHLAQARAAGACAGVVAREMTQEPSDWPLLRVPDVRSALARAARELSGRPDEAVAVWGVTGTNGKTTTAFLLKAIFEAAGERVGLLGTVWNDLGRGPSPSEMTTPDADAVFGALAAMRGAGCSRAAMEVSSHALDQRRVEGLRFAGGVFTNLTQDHLDYHGTMERYLDAKARLFEALDPSAWAVLNADAPASESLRARTRARVRTYGVDRPADVSATIGHCDLSGTDVAFRGDGRESRIHLGLVGRWNVENSLAALAAATASGVPWETVCAALTGAAAPPGRLQPVGSGAPFRVLVDYAHTDAAIDAVLAGVRPLTLGRLVAVFGCGGDRDRAKRPKMARAAERHADLVILTSDNPRTEDPHAILREAQAGLTGQCEIRTVPDRAEAIAQALLAARAGDCVAILGKGHEDYQIVGTRKFPFDDVKVAGQTLREMGYGK